MSEETEEQVVVRNDSFELASVFSFSLNQRILPHCATSARIEPDTRETLVVVSASNKIILRNNESSLHIPEKIKCITTVPFGQGYDYIVVGTESQIMVYDFHQNSTIFRRDIPDGVHCFILIIGSPDSELRIFKNDLMRAELMETDAIVVLQGFDKNRFGYALANGTVGMYNQDQRLWRIKSKSVITAILPYPNDDMVTCIWNSGKNGEVVCRDSLSAGQNVIAGFVSRINAEDEVEFTVVTADGKVYGFNNSKPKELTDKTQETLHLYGQKKHNLLIELGNFEQEEQLTEAEKVKDFRIPIGTTVECKLFVSKSDRTLYLVLEASHEVCIRGVIAFAEGLFEGESYIWIPKLIEGNGDRVQIPIITEKDMANEIHIRTFLGPQES
ncbi:hypothetical protein NECAME_08774 [Necator americanus]|uniref:Bardet-Biedl syndrome 1 N-terminal domain-containing protein n=1 Tax=Necator americanus TaxID=51031 RepID=W2TIN0_NECAM|nr:hypothetical protein NECAME_08774 [Necator americanus]ETN81021.1 hypothetical protein NECAME_08774 [Necator americanus]